MSGDRLRVGITSHRPCRDRLIEQDDARHDKRPIPTRCFGAAERVGQRAGFRASASAAARPLGFRPVGRTCVDRLPIFFRFLPIIVLIPSGSVPEQMSLRCTLAGVFARRPPYLSAVGPAKVDGGEVTYLCRLERTGDGVLSVQHWVRRMSGAFRASSECASGGLPRGRSVQGSPA
jgi:hypothetical protein